MPLKKQTAPRSTDSRSLTITLAALGALVATAAVRSETQINTPPAPPVRRPPIAARPVQQPVAPQQRPRVNVPQTAPNAAANANQMRDVLSRLGPHNANGNAPSAPQAPNTGAVPQMRTPIPNFNNRVVTEPRLRTPLPSVNNRAAPQLQMRAPIPSVNNRAVPQPQMRTPNSPTMGTRILPTNAMT